MSYSITLTKIEKSVNVDFLALPEASRNHVIAYGLKQLLNDAMVSGETDAEREGLAMKRLDGLKSGNLRAAREANPLETEVRRLAIARATAEWKKAGHAKITPEIFKSEDWAVRVLELRENEKIRAIAQANVDATRGLADMDI